MTLSWRIPRDADPEEFHAWAEDTLLLAHNSDLSVVVRAWPRHRFRGVEVMDTRYRSQRSAIIVHLDYPATLDGSAQVSGQLATFLGAAFWRLQRRVERSQADVTESGARLADRLLPFPR